MTKFLKKIGNIALIMGGFFIVFFGLQKVLSHDESQTGLLPGIDGVDIAHADVPGCASDSGSCSCSSDSGSCSCK